MKFSKPFYGCRAGRVYPEHFQPGDECPPELESAAQQQSALEPEDLDARTVNQPDVLGTEQPTHDLDVQQASVLAPESSAPAHDANSKRTKKDVDPAA